MFESARSIGKTRFAAAKVTVVTMRTKLKSVLHLNLHREFFAAIANGTKSIEYRGRTAYWRRRLEGRRYVLSALAEAFW